MLSHFLGSSLFLREEGKSFDGLMDAKILTVMFEQRIGHFQGLL